MKRVLCAGLMFASFSSFAAEPIPSEPVRANAANKPFPHISWRSDSGDSSLDIGGALRTNYRDEHWDTTENNGRFLFDTFRLDVQATYKSLYSDVGYWFQDDGKRSIDRGFVGYRLNANANLQLGAPFKPFGLEPYPQFGWSYHLPFFMGYAVSAGTGLKYSYKDQDWDVQLGYFPRMLPSDLRYSPEVGRYADLNDNAIAFTQSRQDNEKRNQFNARVARTFNSEGWKTEVGASLATAQLYNATTKDNGDYWAAGVHAIISKGLWTVTTQAIRYEYDPENRPGEQRLSADGRQWPDACVPDRLQGQPGFAQRRLRHPHAPAGATEEDQAVQRLQPNDERQKRLGRLADVHRGRAVPGDAGDGLGRSHLGAQCQPLWRCGEWQRLYQHQFGG